jgi:PadR family transcriptional regulator, regulatory protein AphA
VSQPALTTTSYAVLGLLAVRPWSAYELVQQARRSLHYIWPPSESLVYSEPKKLVGRGFATATQRRTGRRTSVVYTITPAGRRALAAWLETAPAAPTLWIEPMVRVTFAEHGSRDSLVGALESLREWADAELARGAEQCREYLEPEFPFPDRLHVIALVAGFYGELLHLLARYSEHAAGLVRGWDGTKRVPFDGNLRALLERAIELAVEREALRP